MAERWDLTIFEPDGITPVVGSVVDGVVVEASFSTDPTHPRPYLDVPTTLAESSIDLLKGAAKIGEYSLVLADVAPIGDQDAGAITAILAGPDGQSAINGRRGLLRTYRGDWMVAMDGPLSTPGLGADRASYALRLRDVRDRERKLQLFARTGTSTVLPRGVLGGYGPLPGGGWLVAPTVPLRGRYQLQEVGILWSTGRIVLDGAPTRAGANATVSLVVTEMMLGPLSHTAPVPGVVFPGSGAQAAIYDQVTILWRPEGTAEAWNEISRMASVFDQGRGIVATIEGKLPSSDGAALDVRAATAIHLSDSGVGTLPADGARVEVIIRYDGPASEAYPFHFEGTAGEFLVAMHNGEFSEKPDGGLPLLGLIDDEDAVLALDTPIRIRSKKVVDDARGWVEKNVYQPLGAAPALDLQGRISPIRYALPAADVEVPEINDAIVGPEASWSHPSDNTVNVVRMKYFRDYRVPEEGDPYGLRSDGDGIASKEVEQEFRFGISPSERLLGEQAHEIETEAFRALGGTDGSPVSGDVADETAAQLAKERTRQATDRYLFGGQIFGLPCRRAGLPNGLREGAWVLVAASFLPEYSTKRRGANRLCQIVTLRPVDPALVELTLEDAGPAHQPVGQPILGTVTATADGVISVPIIAPPERAHARVDYAISPTEPDPASPLWVFLDRTPVVTTLYSPALPAGATVWIRARGEKEGRRPSAWTNPTSILIPATPRVHRVVITLQGEAVVVLGDANTHAGGVRIDYAVHRLDETPTLTTYQDFDADSGEWTLDGVTLRAGEAITVSVEPWSGWTGVAVSGAAGPAVEKRGARATDASSFRITDLETVVDAPPLRTYRVRMGVAVAAAAVHWVVFDAPLPLDHLSIVYDPANLQATLLEDGGEFTVPYPGEGEILKGVVIPRVVQTGGLEIIGDGWEFQIEGTAPPLLFDEPTFTESADGLTSVFSLGLIDPRGVATGVDLFFTEIGVDSGPFAASAAGSVYSYSFSLHPDHPVFVRVRINRNDGGDPIWLGPYTADTDKTPGMPNVRRGRVVNQEQLLVDADDTDAASLWYREDIAGVLGAETAIAPRGGDPRFGAFTVTAGTTERKFRIYAKNSAMVAGEYRLVIVEPYVAPRSARAVMREIPSESGNVATLFLVAIDGATFDTVEFATKQGAGLWGSWATDAVAPYSASVGLVEKHLSQIAYKVSEGGDVLQEGVVAFDSGNVADVKDAIATPDGAGIANLRAYFDTDTVIGASQAQYRVDGGAPAALTVAADRTATWTVAQSPSAELLVEVQGKNSDGTWGPWFPVAVPLYVPIPTVPPVLTKMWITIDNAGSCPSNFLGLHVHREVFGSGAGFKLRLLALTDNPVTGEIDEDEITDAAPADSGYTADLISGWIKDTGGLPNPYWYRYELITDDVAQTVVGQMERVQNFKTSECP